MATGRVTRETRAKRAGAGTPPGRAKAATGAKPRLFIGSSTEALRIAEALKSEIEQQKVCQVALWRHVFRPGTTTLDALLAEVNRTDFAIFIFHPDDHAQVRGKSKPITRDNVVFEYGLFMTKLGHERTLALRPAGSRLAELTDDRGFTYINYDIPAPTSDLRSDLMTPALEVARIVNALGPRRPTPQSSESVRQLDPLLDGIAKLYPNRMEAVEDMLRDIATAEASVRMYARVYLSELVKHPDLPASLAKAAGQASGLTVRWVSCCGGGPAAVAQLYAIEDPERARWKTRKAYATHLAEADSSCNLAVERARAHLGSSRKGLRIERGSYGSFIPPYSMLLVDTHTAYVSLYKASSYGTFSPTFRIARDAGKLTGPMAAWLGEFLPPGPLDDPPHVLRRARGK